MATETTTAASSDARLALDTSLKLVERILTRAGQWSSKLRDGGNDVTGRIERWLREHVTDINRREPAPSQGRCHKVILRQFDGAGKPTRDVASLSSSILLQDPLVLASMLFNTVCVDARENPESRCYMLYAYYSEKVDYVPRIFFLPPGLTTDSARESEARREREHGEMLVAEVESVADELRQLLLATPPRQDHYAETMRTAANRLRDIVDQVKSRCSDHDCDCCFGSIITDLIDDLMESSACVPLARVCDPAGTARREPFVTSVSHCLGKEIEWGNARRPVPVDLNSHDALATCVGLLSPRYDVMINHSRETPNSVRIILDDLGGRFLQK